MIAAISLMRRRSDVSLATFRRHWLDVHGPLVCAFAGLRRYVQHHVIESPAMNGLAREMRVDGFPIVMFDHDADRLKAHGSPEMAACNVDSRQFIGAVSRVICRHNVVLAAPAGYRAHPLAGVAARRIGGRCCAGSVCWRISCRVRGLCGAVLYRVLQQGPAPNSTIPHLPISVAGIAELAFASLVDLECAMEGNNPAAAHFVVEEHRLV